MIFDKVKSGIFGVDLLLDNIRLGDNVVWQVADISEYEVFVKPFAAQAIRDGRNLVYIRFAQHEPLLEPQNGLKIVEFNTNEGFESFAVQVHDVIEREGKETFYVFDSISALQKAWASDFMIRNFFLVTCPYLHQMETVCYFYIS